MIEAVVLDVEGTTSPTSSVRVDLYRYVHERLGLWLDRGDPDQAAVIAATRRTCADGTLDAAGTAATLRSWLDADRKVAVLKDAQGLICHEGFRNGDLRGRFFPDVHPAVRTWTATGVAVHIYSSGSVQNQRDWFAHAEQGSLSAHITGYFDLESAGRKDDPQSYRRIAAVTRTAPSKSLFVSDSTAELDAAATAGWSVAGVARAGEPRPSEPSSHIRWHSSLAQLADLRLPDRKPA